MSEGQGLEASTLDVIKSIEKINSFSRALLPSRSDFFQRVSLSQPALGSTHELVFIRSVSWLYVLYFEAGRGSIKHLLRSNSHMRGHRDLVQALRTWSQHNLDPTSTRAADIESSCTKWFLDECGTRIPREDAHWAVLCESLVGDAKAFLEDIVDVIAAIEESPGCSELVKDWQRSLSRDWPAHAYHEVIASAASDAGFDSVDAARFYGRYGDTLRQHLQLLDDDCDHEFEIRKVVEMRLVSETEATLPVTGQQIMEHFDLGPGPAVGELLGKARQIFSNLDRCDAQELLRLLERSEGSSGR